MKFRCAAFWLLFSTTVPGGCGRAGYWEPESAVEIFDLNTGWATSRSICWRWDRIGEEEEFGRYELVLGHNLDDVANRTGSAQVWTAEENPELGVFQLPYTTGFDPVLSTITDELLPDTEYFAELVGFDREGRHSVSRSSARTLGLPAQCAVLFADEPTSGYSIPTSFVYSDRAPYQGTHHYEYISVCDPGEDLCFQNLRRRSIRAPTGDIDAADFAGAYYEFAVASDSTKPSWWSQGRLHFGSDGNYDEGLHVFGGWTMPAVEDYRLKQLPLHVFTRDEQPLTREVASLGIYEFTVGGLWSHGALVRVDEVRICW